MLGFRRVRRNILLFGPIKASEGFISGRAHENHIALVFVYARLGANQIHPLLRFLFGRGAEVVVTAGREYAKDVLDLSFRVLLARDCSDVGEGDLVAELGLVLVAVDGEEVRAEDNVDGLPLLR